MIDLWVVYVVHVPSGQENVEDAAECRLFNGVALTYPYCLDLAALMANWASYLEALSIGALC